MVNRQYLRQILTLLFPLCAADANSGPVVDLAETELCQKLEECCVLVNSDVSFTFSVAGAGCREGSTVWTVSNTFVASANAPRNCGAHVGFCDINSRLY